MSDNVQVTAGSGTTIAADEVTDGTLGTVKVQFVKIMDGTLDGTTKAAVGAGGLKVDGSGVTQPVSAASLPLPTGASTAAKQPALGTAGSASADVISVQGIASMTALKVDGSATNQPTIPAGRTYKTVAASQTGQTLGTGATGDVLDGVLVVPATTSPGQVLVLDNATSITVFTGGTNAVSNLVPFWIALNSSASVSGAWKVTTGANVSVVAVGKFTP